MKRKFTFGTRALLAIVTVAALLAFLVSRQLRGRIVSEVDAIGNAYHMTLAPTLVVSKIPNISGVLAETLSLLDARVPGHGLIESDIHMCEVVDPDNPKFHGITYTFNRRGRQRFSFENWACTFDPHDPVSQDFNDVVRETIEEAIAKSGVTVMQRY